MEVLASSGQPQFATLIASIRPRTTRHHSSSFVYQLTEALDHF